MKTKLFFILMTLFLSTLIVEAQDNLYAEIDVNDLVLLSEEDLETEKTYESNNLGVYSSEDDLVIVCTLSSNGLDTIKVCSAKASQSCWGRMVSNGDDAFTFEQDQFRGAEVYSMAFTDAENGCAIGMMVSCSATCGVVFRTDDGGKNWKLQYRSGTDMKLKTIGFDDADNGWVIGQRSVAGKSFSTMLVTADGGETWLENAYTPSGLSEKMTASLDSSK